MDAYQLKIVLHGSKPLIWRRVLVPDCLNFAQLAMIINESMGWIGKHLCDFEFDELDFRIEDPPEEDESEYEEAVLRAKDTYLRQVFAETTKFVYTYDYGDNWLHDVTVEKVVPYYPYKYPQVVKYQGDCPPEDCGGLIGYYQALSEVNEEYNIRDDIIPYDMEEINNFFQQNLHLNMARIDRRNVYELYEEIYGEEKPGLYGKVPVAAKKTVTEVLDEMDGFFLPVFDVENKKADTWPYWSIRDILKDWDEDTLQHIARQKQIEAAEDTSYEELPDKITDYMADEQRIESYFYVLSDEEDEALRQFINSEGKKVPVDLDLLAVMFQSDYMTVTDEDELMIPREVVRAYQKASAREDYHDIRHKRHWLACCVKMANKLYGVTPGDILQELTEKDPDYAVSRENLWAEVAKLPFDVYRYEIKDDTLLTKYIGDESREQIFAMQGDIPFYKPTWEEIIAGPMAGYDRRLVQKLTKFLQRETYIESTFAIKRLQESLLDLVIGGMRGSDATEILLEHADIKLSRTKREKLNNLLLEISYHVPTIVLRGFKPSSMSTARLMSLQNKALQIFKDDMKKQKEK